MMDEQLLQSRIRDGAEWLDTHAEGWRDRVQVIDLDLTNTCTCVLGQVFSADAERLFHSEDYDGVFTHWNGSDGKGSGTHYYPGYWWVINRDDHNNKLTAFEARALAFDYSWDADYTWDDMTYAWRGYLKGEWE
jgi:hypothetical protein